MRRSIVSVPSNIAEGYGRNSKKEFIRFCQIAQGSLFEFQTQIDLSYMLGYLKESDFNYLSQSSREIEAGLSSFIKYLKKTQ